MKFCIVLLACIAISFCSSSQTIPKNPNVTDGAGLRQGKWTLLFDSNWNPVTEYKKAVYYRLIAYSNDKPTGVVRDYYPSGKVQWEGQLLEDRPKEINHGPCIWYTEKGNKEVKRVFENGKVIEEVYYNLDGSIAEETWTKLNSRSIAAFRDGNYIESISLGEKAKAQAEKQHGKQSKDYSISLNNLAFKYKDLGLHDKAEPLYQESLRIREKLVGKNHPDYAVVLSNLGALYVAKGLYEKGEANYIDAKQIYKTVYGVNNADYARVVSNMGLLYKNLGQYNKAEALYIEAKDIRKEILGEEDEEYGVSLNNLAVLYDLMGQYQKAEPLYLASIKIDEKIYGTDHPEYAISIDNLGSLYEVMGQYQKAEALFQQALKINEKSTGKTSQAYATTVGHLADLYATLGSYDKSLKLYAEQRTIYEKVLGKDNPEYLVLLNNLATVYENMGLLQKSETLMLETKAMTLKLLGEKHPNYALVLNNLATLYFTMGYYEKSEVYHLESKDIRAKTLGKDHPSYATSLSNLGNLYQYMGFYDKAEMYYNESKAILEKSGQDHPNYTIVLNNLALIYIKQGLYRKAEETFLVNKNREERTLGKDHPSYSISLNNLADLYQLMGRYKKAESLYLEVHAIYSKSLGTETSDYAASLNNLANLYETMGEYVRAEQLYLQAKDILLRVLNPYHPRYDIVLVTLVNLYQKMKMPEKAAAYMRESSKIKSAQIKRYFPSLSESEKELYYRTIKTDFEYFNSFGILSAGQLNLISALYNNQISTKALLFDAGNRIRSNILQNKDTAVVNLYSRWQTQRDFLSKAYKMPAAQKQKDNIDIEQLEEGINSLEKQLSLKSELFLQVSENYTWTDVRKNLNKDECAIELIRFRKFGITKTLTDSSDVALPRYTIHDLTDTVFYAALIVKPNSKQPEIVLLNNGNLMESGYFKRYKNCIQFKIADTTSYTAFWEPISRILKKDNIRKVYLSPDGVYNSINLYTLQNPITKKYLVDELSLQLVTNTKDIISKKKSGKMKLRDAALFGYPDYSGNDSTGINYDNTDRAFAPSQNSPDNIQRVFDSGKISTLPGTKTEITAVGKLLAARQVSIHQYLEREANEGEIKLLRSPQILHIATHGFFLGDINSGATAITTNLQSKKAKENPLFRSGLLFSGSQQTLDGHNKQGVEDGVLTAYEAMSLSLNDTDLVVLSACETGLGEIRNGEGVYGLQRAFQTAGAKSVLMSLWKVDDTATQELMTAFYSNWLKSGDKRDAFKKAQASVRTKYQHPYYWGAFVLVGE